MWNWLKTSLVKLAFDLDLGIAKVLLKVLSLYLIQNSTVQELIWQRWE